MSEPKPLEAELAIKERLNFPYILASQILTFQKSILAQEYSAREIEESIKGFVNLIPLEWRDDKFEKEMKKAERTRTIDQRPFVVAGVRMNPELCKTLGVKAFKKEQTWDYYKLFQACINLLYRRKLLTRIERVEKLESIDLESTNLEANEVWESNLSSEQE